MSSTAEQRKQIIAAFDAGDDVRAVTVALSIAASMARSGNTTGAMSIRSYVDRIHADAHRQAAHRKMRLEIASMRYSMNSCIRADEALKEADDLIMANEAMPVPENTENDK